MPRSIKKNPFYDNYLLDKIMKQKKEKKNGIIIQTKSRRSTILPQFMGFTIAVYNGREYIPIYITESMVGHKLGEFSPTRTYRGHNKKDKTIQKK